MWIGSAAGLGAVLPGPCHPDNFQPQPTALLAPLVTPPAPLPPPQSFLADIEDLATLPPCAAQQQQEQQQQRQEQQPQRQHNGTAPTSAMPAAPAVPAPPLPRVAEAPAGPDAASGASLSSDAQSSKGVPDAGAVGQREDVEEVSLGNEQVLRVSNVETSLHPRGSGVVTVEHRYGTAAVVGPI